ncbi:MAG: alkaline phosphatase [Saprospiraceae bacterium]|nr:alkaline phosphatase [Saprospiraceae bacterium]
MIKHFIFALCCLISIASCKTHKNSQLSEHPGSSTKFPLKNTNKKAKNIILMIGDGMGITQISAGMYSNGNSLNLERFLNMGLHKSYSSDNLITDSAAGATAFACGIKTYNGAIGVDPDTNAVYTILEEAEDKGLKSGLIATSTIDHATPASFIAHNKARKNYEEIALDFLKTDCEIFIGGGQKSFERREMDDRNLTNELREKGYKVVSFVDQEIDEIDMEGVEKLMYYTADGSPLPVSQGRDYLQPAANLAINHLEKSNENGFFLMIEGSQIDWGGHANDANWIITEMIEFDRTIGAVLDFAEKDQNTLVIVTADHETGGFAIQKDSKMDSLVTAFTSDYHTGDLIPVFAYGPGSEKFRGIYENTSIYNKMREAFGWVDKK